MTRENRNQKHHTFTKVLAVICEGDAELEQGNDDKALACYLKAAKMEDNFVTTNTAIFKAGMVQLKKGNNDKAASLFKEIKKYPEATEYREADKYIAYAEAAAKK